MMCKCGWIMETFHDSQESYNNLASVKLIIVNLLYLF